MSVLAVLGWGAAHAQAVPPASGPAGAGSAYDFAYRVVGDTRVAPVQVFDDGRQTYMQFRVGQLLPAIFRVEPQGEKLASVAWQGGYAVVEGTAGEFSLRIGNVVARAHYQGSALRPGANGGADGRISGVPVVPGMKGAAGQVPARPAQGYEATPADRNIRQALMRWAKAAGWTFEAEHWTVDVDIPLAGSARLGSDFKAAVRTLLASTELSAHPLQPCFYSNLVLRVIPYAESCDRTASAGGRQG
ncbi:MAG: TcpQ domain-containing protein [Pigmentiphaga sp.]|uniref:TcpQ domain-containing protein n=1 Tax=Pigmentiphaga sp. TaxID=1977564 RepID=UPI0029A7B636|nr:TcpQ domain-containing protein [Pigmentiphaga sp.]MDX3907344.1 TcpQ domain-containing protein [Pigmentiphaga sp.]